MAEAIPKVGKLAYRITVQSPRKGVDDDGTVVTGWDLVASVWASIKLSKPGKVAAIAERAQSMNILEMDIRYLDIPADSRVLFEDKVGYVINAGDVWGDGNWTRIWVDVRQGETP